MTQTDPMDRIKPSEILKHPFITALEAEFEFTKYDEYMERLNSKLVRNNLKKSYEYYT